MSRNISSFLPVAGDAAAVRDRFIGDPGRWLPGARACGPDRWYVTVRYRGLSRTVEAHVGEVWTAGSTAWRALTWRPVPDDRDVAAIERLLPTLTAELGLHGRGADTSLVLSGTYAPPGARLGELADVVLLHRVAERTAASFLEDIARLLAGATVPAG